MAPQFALGHKHCQVCGACFIGGITKDIHKCPEKVDPAVLEVFLLDRDRRPARPTFATFNADGVISNSFDAS